MKPALLLYFSMHPASCTLPSTLLQSPKYPQSELVASHPCSIILLPFRACKVPSFPGICSYPCVPYAGCTIATKFCHRMLSVHNLSPKRSTLLASMLRLPSVAAAVLTLVGSILATSYYPPRVQTTSGTIIGHQASVKTDVTEFLGIRYAEAPIGNLRFAAPKTYVAPEGVVFEASQWVKTIYQCDVLKN